VFFERDGESLGGDVIEVTALAEAAREADAILYLSVKDGECTEWDYDPETIEERARPHGGGSIDSHSGYPRVVRR
jgi:hypothetical protein